MKNIKNFKLSLVLFIALILITSIYCKNKRGKFELILDEFIGHFNINKSKNCVLITLNNKWSDSTSILILTNLKKEEATLFDTIYTSSYRGINIYFNGKPETFPISNDLLFEKVILKHIEYNKIEYYDPDEIQIVFSRKDDCLLDVLGVGSNTNYFKKTFSYEGLLCK